VQVKFLDSGQGYLTDAVLKKAVVIGTLFTKFECTRPILLQIESNKYVLESRKFWNNFLGLPFKKILFWFLAAKNGLMENKKNCMKISFLKLKLY
jgi:hypothetical protein